MYMWNIILHEWDYNVLVIIGSLFFPFYLTLFFPFPVPLKQPISMTYGNNTSHLSLMPIFLDTHTFTFME